MPTEEVMKASMQAYIDTYNRGNAEAVTALYTDDATVEDPVGTPLKRGRAEILKFYTQAMTHDAELSLDAPIRASHGNAAAMAFSARIGALTVRVIDVMTFDEAGRFTSMRAFFGPSDFIKD